MWPEVSRRHRGLLQLRNLSALWQGDGLVEAMTREVCHRILAERVPTSIKSLMVETLCEEKVAASIVEVLLTEHLIPAVV